ncbi:BON domain-containing protein [Derxia lacustris]|uniref:BON domain-containing protein n=1 Tax=Derxia lacustris TaxID=764842 RepID=UPI00111C6452|nr:BON domain-containing protein [Derxia lacustris]
MGVTTFDPRTDAAAASQLIRAKGALGHATGLDPDRIGLRFAVEGGRAVVSGELPDLARRKRAAVALADAGVVDRLRVAVANWPGDGPTANRVARLFEENIDFRNCALALVNGVSAKSLRSVGSAGGEQPSGSIDISVSDGVVLLAGEVISLSHKRLASALAWWSETARDVDNRLRVLPAEADNDGELAEALKLVLETDPQLSADGIAVGARSGAVMLTGQVSSPSDIERAERDAWSLDGVREVVNRLVLAG